MPRVTHVATATALALLIAGAAFGVTRSTAGDHLPAAELTPRPTAIAATTPAELVVPVDELAHAPLGRTGLAAVDRMLDGLVALDAPTLAALSSAPWEGTGDCTAARFGALDADAATRAFAEARPPLHAVFVIERGDAAPPGDQYAVVFGRARANEGAIDAPRAWQIDVTGAHIAAVTTHCGHAGVLFEPPLSEIERYLLLPPPSDLPTPVALHDSPPPSGYARLDAVVAEATGGDAAAIAHRMRTSELGCSRAESPPLAAPPCDGDSAPGTAVAVFPVNECGRLRFVDLPSAREELSAFVGTEPPALHAIGALPVGYVPAGDALVLLARETRRYNWESLGLVIDGDAITGLVAGCGDGRPDWLYPPTVFAGPFADAAGGGGPTWSGIPAVDRAIVALSDRSGTRQRDAFDPVLIACVTAATGIGSPPLCLDDEPPGTLVPVLPVTACELAYVREQAFDELAARLAQVAPRLYAVTAPPRGFAELWRLASYMLLVFDAAATAPSAAYPVIAVSETGIAGFSSGCGGSLTSNLLRPSASSEFLVPPPR